MPFLIPSAPHTASCFNAPLRPSSLRLLSQGEGASAVPVVRRPGQCGGPFHPFLLLLWPVDAGHEGGSLRRAEMRQGEHRPQRVEVGGLGVVCKLQPGREDCWPDGTSFTCPCMHDSQHGMSTVLWVLITVVSGRVGWHAAAQW